MKNKNLVFILVLFLILLMPCSQVYAFGWRRPAPPRHGHFHVRGDSFDILPFAAATLLIAGATYYYWEGEYYRRESNRYIVVNPPVGAVVTALPAGYQTVVVDGVPYYIVNGVTYIYTTTGYQVVPQPKTIVINTNNPNNSTVEVTTSVSTASSAKEAYTINIPNARGTYTAVTLKRSGSGFVGPQGEYYSEFPSINQLKVMYGK